MKLLTEADEAVEGRGECKMEISTNNAGAAVADAADTDAELLTVADAVCIGQR